MPKEAVVYVSDGKHAPTEEMRHMVMQMVACGLESHDIAYILHVSPYEVELHYKEELENGLRMTTGIVGAALLTQAKAGVVEAQTFWLKHRAGWQPPQKVELTGRDGNPIEVIERKKAIDNVVGLMMQAIDPRKNDPVPNEARRNDN